MTENGDFSAVVRAVLHRDRIGHRLLLMYYAVSAVVVIAGCAVQPAYAGIDIGAGFAIGVLLLADVSLSNRRARRPLLAHWPDLATIPPAGSSRSGRKGNGPPAQPHSGGTAVFFVVALLLIAAAGGTAMALADAAAGSVPDHAPLAVILGTLLVVLVPVLTYLYVTYRRQVREPYLNRLEHALSEAARGHAPPEQGPAGAAGPVRVRARLRPREYIWGGLIIVILVGRVGLLIALIAGAAIGTGGSSTTTAGTSKPGFPASPWPTGSPYPSARVSHSVVTDTAAGLTYAAPPGTGWTQDTSPVYPVAGAELTEPVPGQSGDEADIVSAPLPAGISYTGVSALQDATASYAANMLGTWFSAHSDTVLANHALSACGRHAWLAEVRVRYTKEKLPDETVAIVVLDLGRGRRPGTLYVDVPDVMDPGLAGKLAQSVRPAAGC